MAKKILFLLVLFSFKGFSQDYFTSLYSITLSSVNDKVYDVLDDTINNRLYVAGNFTSIGGNSRNYVACFNRSTGTFISSFNANISIAANNSVKTLLLYNGVLYLGGYFSNVSGQTRIGVAAVNPVTGALINSFVCNTNSNSRVNCLLSYNNRIYIGGDFHTINSTTINNLAVVSPVTGSILPITANIASNVSSGITKMVNHNSSIYISVGFGIVINGTTRNYLAKIDANTGVLDSWNPKPNGSVNDITIFENELNITGAFTSIFSTNYNYYVRMNLLTDLPINTTLTNIFTNVLNPPMLWSCGVWIENYLTPLNSSIVNYPLNFVRFKDKSFINTYYNISGYNDYITLLIEPNNNNNILSFDFHPCNVPNGIDGWRFPYIRYGFSVNGSEIQGLDFMKGMYDRMYTTTNRTSSVTYPGSKKIEVLGCMPKIPTAFAISSGTVCAGTKNIPYKIEKYPYTKQYSWSYSGTGVTINGTDTSVTLNFAPNATSGRLAVKCKGIADRNVLNGNSLGLPIDSVFLNITVNPIPSVNAGSNLTSNCTNNKVVTLNGSASGNNTWWYKPTGAPLSNNLNYPLINELQGNYVLSSTITATGCSWRDTAYVTVDTLKPNLTMPVVANTRLCCANPSINLNASSSTSGVTYTWANNNGFTSSNPVIISTTSPTVPVNNMTYSLIVTNPGNGCKNNNSITLLLDTVHPTFGLGVSTVGAKISCIATSASINGTSGVSRAKLFWNGVSLPINSSNPVIVTIPTTYTLMARDTINGCQSYMNYTVIADTVKPTINPLPNTKYLTCDTTQVTLNATSPSVNTTFTWTPPVGAALPNPSFVTNSGTYTLNATDVTNGCSRTRNLTVIVDTLKPNLSTAIDSVMLSCSTLSYTLNANSTTSPTTINWIGTGGYTSANPAIITNQGFYTTTVKNTFNGCTTSKLIKVSIDSTKPYIIPFSNNFQINCSYTTAVLSGATIPSNKFVLSWQGASGFNTTNPAIVNTAGTYTFTALDTATGCQSIKVVNLNYQPVLALNAGNDTTICFGTSANLKVSPIGGTPNFNYTWSNGTATNTTIVSPIDTTSYIVTVSDNAGCIGKDTVVVIVPAPIQDSSKTFLPCDPNSPYGQIQTFPYGGIPPYQFAVGSGAYQSSNIFPNLILATHTIHIKDNLGCSKSSTVTIDNSSLRPEPNFLISTKMFKSDTFVVVDISNPRPDSVHWSFPPTCTIIDNSNPFSPVIVNSDTGNFVINLKAFFGTCEMNKAKLVHVGTIDTMLATQSNNNGIESIILYPNPNSGQFNVEVKLYKKQTFAVLIYDAFGVERYRKTINESNYFNQLINMTSATPGSYILKVIAEYDAKQKAFIISQ